MKSFQKERRRSEFMGKTKMKRTEAGSGNLKEHFKRNWPYYVMMLPGIIYLVMFKYIPMLIHHRPYRLPFLSVLQGSQTQTGSSGEFKKGKRFSIFSFRG